jgi:DNA-binding CsgD family transcriptional regulator/PAS domain-containing protein
LIADFYEAAIEPDGLARMPDLMRSAMGVDTAGVWIVEGPRITDMALTPDLLDSQKPYLEHFYKLDPWRPAGCEKVILGPDSISEPQLLKTEFYNDFARPFGLFRPLGAATQLRAGVLATFAIHQPATKHLFEEGDRQSFAAILPHMRRALQLWLRRRTEQSKANWQTSALDQLAFGVVVCDESGRLVHANPAAETLARSGAGFLLGGAGKGVRALVAREANELAALIHGAARGDGGGAMRLTGRDGVVSLVVLVAPLPAKLHRGGEPGHVLLAMRAPEHGSAPSAANLIAVFRLSPTQAALALALYEGTSFEEFAAARGVKVSTLRTHFAEILARTGAKSLRDLVRLLGTLPPLQ